MRPIYFNPSLAGHSWSWPLTYQRCWLGSHCQVLDAFCISYSVASWGVNRESQRFVEKLASAAEDTPRRGWPPRTPWEPLSLSPQHTRTSVLYNACQLLQVDTGLFARSTLSLSPSSEILARWKAVDSDASATGFLWLQSNSTLNNRMEGPDSD